MNIPTESEELMDKLLELEDKPEVMKIASIGLTQIKVVRAAIDKEKELRRKIKCQKTV